MKKNFRNMVRGAALAVPLAVCGIVFAADASAAITECAQFLGLKLQEHAQRQAKAAADRKHGGGSRRSILSPVAPFILDHSSDTDHS